MSQKLFHLITTKVEKRLMYFTGFGETDGAKDSPLFCSNKQKALPFLDKSNAENILQKVNSVNTNAEITVCTNLN